MIRLMRSDLCPLDFLASRRLGHWFCISFIGFQVCTVPGVSICMAAEDIQSVNFSVCALHTPILPDLPAAPPEINA